MTFDDIDEAYAKKILDFIARKNGFDTFRLSKHDDLYYYANAIRNCDILIVYLGYPEKTRYGIQFNELKFKSKNYKKCLEKILNVVKIHDVMSYGGYYGFLQQGITFEQLCIEVDINVCNE